MLALSVAVFAVGVSFGAISVPAGLSTAQASVMSLTVFAGGAQFMAVGVVGAGGSAVAAVLAGLLLNARHLPFGLAIGDVLTGHGSARTRRRALLVGSHFMLDESVAFALSRENAAHRRRAYWLAGSVLFVAWNVATVLGSLAGRAVGDPAAFGIDAAFPAGMLALVLPALRERAALRVAVAAAAVALVSAPLLPPGVPVLVALLGLVFALPTPGRRADRAPGVA